MNYKLIQNICNHLFVLNVDICFIISPMLTRTANPLPHTLIYTTEDIVSDEGRFALGWIVVGGAGEMP